MTDNWNPTINEILRRMGYVRSSGELWRAPDDTCDIDTVEAYTHIRRVIAAIAKATQENT